MNESHAGGGEELLRLRRLNAHLSAYRDVNERLLDASTLEEVASIAVETMEEVFGAQRAVMMLAAGPDRASRAPWISDTSPELLQHFPEVSLLGLLQLAVADGQPLAEPDAPALLERLGLPPAPGVRNLLLVPLQLGVACLGAVVGYNLLAPEHLPRDAEDALALLGPVGSAVSHTWLLDARARETRQLESILEHAASYIAYLDRDSRVLRANSAYAEAAGLAKETVLGKRHFDLFHNEESERIFRQARDTGRPVQVLERPFLLDHQRERGVTYWDYNLTPVKNQRGEVEGLVFSLTDRTERVRQRLQLEAAEQERLREARVTETILDNTASVVLHLDPDFTIRRVNAAAERAVDIPREEIVGRSIFFFFPEIARHVPVDRIRERGQRVAFRQMPLFLPGKGPRTLTYWDWSTVPMVDESGRVEGLVLTANEVTQEVRARQQIAQAELQRAREARLLAIIQESTDNNLMYLDRELRILQANSAFLTSLHRSREEVVAKSLTEVLPRATEFTAIVRRVVSTGEAVVLREMSLPPLFDEGGGLGYWDFIITPIRDEREAVEGIVVSGLDITESIQTRQRLLEEERSRTRLAEALNAELNHRVKNNLAMVAGMLQMQIAGRPPDDPVVEVLRQAVSRVRGIAAVHEQLHETRIQDVEMVDAIRRMVRVSRQTLAGDHVHVTVEGEPALYPSRSATTVCIMINELITNAMKHGRPGEQGTLDIRVRVLREEGRLCIDVWNSGTALTGEFDLDGRTGMGLRLVQGITVDQFEGSFTLGPYRDGTLARVVLEDRKLWDEYF